MTTRTISNLPRDLLEEIISRVPLKLMKAVKSTCKSWNSITKSENFKKLHIDKVKAKEGGSEEAMVIANSSHDIYLMRVVIDEVNPSIEPKGKLSFLHKQVGINRVLHCEGLLLCVLKDVTRIVVWNPYLGQTRWIKLRCSQRFNYALGYEDKGSRPNLKILRFLDEGGQFSWYEMYDFDSGLWTTLDVTPHWRIYCSSHSLSLKGNAYWPARERISEHSEDHIICFDFTRERFGPLPPLPPVNDAHVYVTLSCVNEEKLAALFLHHFDCEFEIWVTTTIEAEMVSWSKFLKMDTHPNVHLPSSYFIDERKKAFMWISKEYDFDCEESVTFINVIGESGNLIKKRHVGDFEVLADWNSLLLCSKFGPNQETMHESKQ